MQELEAIGFLWTTERSKRQNDDWNKRLDQLKKYKLAHGDCLVPHGYDNDNAFAEWIHRQRTTHAAMIKDPEQTSELVKMRMQKLEDLDFNFTVHEDKWMDNYEQLKKYKAKHGNCTVPTHYAENPRLGRWTHTQRHQRRQQAKGKRTCMTNERIALLDEIGFHWEVRTAFQNPRATWQQRYDELRFFHLKHGHFRISPQDDPLLHTWAIEQRARLRNIAVKGQGSSRRMSPDRAEALARIGFTKTVDLGRTLLKLPADGAPKTAEFVDDTVVPGVVETVESVTAEGSIPPSTEEQTMNRTNNNTDTITMTTTAAAVAVAEVTN